LLGTGESWRAPTPALPRSTGGGGKQIILGQRWSSGGGGKRITLGQRWSSGGKGKKITLDEN
jgi:hypothetical protein